MALYTGSKTRAFIAVEIPEQIRLGLASIVIKQNFRIVKPENIHITLFFLGSITDEQIEAVKRVMYGIDMHKFIISIKGIGAFTPRAPRVIFAQIEQGSEALSGMFERMRDEISKYCKIESREFIPHITIARSTIIDSASKGAIGELMHDYKDHDFGSFECNGIVLKKSVLSSAGPTYSDLFFKVFS